MRTNMTRSADRSARRPERARSLSLLGVGTTPPIPTLRRCNTIMYGIGVVLGARLLSPRHTRRPMGRAARARQGVVSRQVGPAAAAAGPLMILDVDPKICPPKDAVSHETRSRTGVQNCSPEPPPPNLTSCMHIGHKPQKGHCLIVVCGVWCAFFLNGPENLMFIYIYTKFSSIRLFPSFRVDGLNLPIHRWTWAWSLLLGAHSSSSVQSWPLRPGRSTVAC